ncbi:MAG: RNA polymerase sigma-70 factor [Bacteroidota bacterium]
MNYAAIEDHELLNLIASHDEHAFREVYVRYWKSVFLLAYKKVHSKEVAEELTQNLFISLWEKRQENRILNLQPWLFTSIRYGIINYYKSQIVHEKYLSYIQGSTDEFEHTTEQLTLFQDLSEAIEKGIALLPQKTQEVFKLSRVENRSVKEISQAMNISEKAVEYHITQSLRLMRIHLKDYLVFSLLWSGLL